MQSSNKITARGPQPVDSSRLSTVNGPPLGVRPIHGGIKAAELRALGLKPEDVLDFSASISPLGPPEGVWEAMRRVDLTAYPDPQCLELREALSQHLIASPISSSMGEGQACPERSPRDGGIPPLPVGAQYTAALRSNSRGSAVSLGPERILVGNGSTELIHLLARSFLSPPCSGTNNKAFLLTPTYGEYEGACQLVGASVSHLGSQGRTGFSWDLEEANRRIAAERPSLVFLCNPNNPTGVYLQQPEVESLAEAAAGVGGLLVLDEAYISFVHKPWESMALLERDNVALLRSMTKDYALTGLRLGYALASAETIGRLASWQPDWSVNGLAQAAGMAALADGGYLPRARAAVAQSKEYLTSQLTALGFRVMPSSANFLLVQVGDAAAWREKLMRRGLFVRDCTSFGLPEYIRIGLRALPDCQRLVQGIAAIKTS